MNEQFLYFFVILVSYDDEHIILINRKEVKKEMPK